MPPSPNEAAAGKTAADALFDEFLQARTKDIVSCTDKQSGQLDGMWFGRANLREHIATGADIRGVMYVGRDGSAVIVLRSFDAPSHLQESEKLGAAAVLTFRKKR